MGFLKSMMIASYFGADYVTDAYYLSSGIVSNVFYAIAASVSVAFLPLYIKVKEKNGINEGKQFASRVLVNMSLISCFVTLVLIEVAPLVIKITASSYTENQFQNAVLFLRIMSFGIIFSLVADIMQNLMNAEKIYGYASISSIINSLVLILAVFFFSKKCGIMALVIATPLSYAIQFLFLKLRSRKYVRFTFKYGIKDKNIKLLCKQAMPIFFSNATIEINQLIDRILLVSIAEGAVTALSYAAVLFQFAAHVLSMPISTITYTEISQACAKKEISRIGDLLRQALKMIFLIGLPISVVIFMVPTLIVEIVYGRGAYNVAAIMQTAGGLKYYAFCLIPYCIKQVFTKAFYSMSDTKTPMKVGIMEVCVNICTSIVLAKLFGIEGVVMGTAIASLLFSLILIILFHKKYVPLNLGQERAEVGKIFIALIMTIILGGIIKNIEMPIHIVLLFVIYTVIILLVYGILLIIMKEDMIWNIIRKLNKCIKCEKNQKEKSDEEIR